MQHQVHTLAMLNTYITANLQLEAGDRTVGKNLVGGIDTTR